MINDLQHNTMVLVLRSTRTGCWNKFVVSYFLFFFPFVLFKYNLKINLVLLTFFTLL